MRIKLSLPNQTSYWYPVDGQETVSQLKSSVIQRFSLDFSASEMALALDRFTLLPHHFIKDVIRENDTICIEHSLLSLGVKRKQIEEPATEKDGEKKKRVKVIKSKKKADKRKSKEESAILPLDVNVRKKKATVEHPKEVQELIQLGSLPFQGLKRTQRRNARRRVLKKAYRESQKLPGSSV
ncbi:hypothetical protein BY458DRAFT_591391 [Sporodiniella umbellata]|nr:hypothetical protein BY458DRAFT_591391 [Sporodiniella umbellata]